ncbi:PREDICTED: U-box domain-containing protein 54-like [Brassica oleracea var. oleracea]|uniref:U-box domain-containing protein 54-like n=1 Tax=Brassica oleracea var. oleracea TaxID=109376 RepID=UPI0006A74778|nr:PREDICTED: U-box domain-containing protein 54-like [Brassica oleracea var. oleracea]
MGETLYSDVIYVAVNQCVPESELNLLWTLKTLRVKKLCLLQVLIPFSPNPSCGLSKSEIKAIQDSELKTSYDSLYKYRDICSNEGVNEKDVGISLVSGYDVGEEIVKLINQNNIKKLVMGAAANPHYSRGMSITSRKAEYVSQHAPTRCKIWFICKGKLIKTREGSFDLGSDSLKKLGTPTQNPNTGNNPDKDHSVNNESDADCAPEDYFCPISKDIMRDPLVAADGFTYEAKNIRYWLNVGNNTSPQTGARLAHRDLTPNYTLRSLIMDWLQHHPNYKH